MRCSLWLKIKYGILWNYLMGSNLYGVNESFKINKDSNGNIEYYKTRLVTIGFTQKEA